MSSSSPPPPPQPLCVLRGHSAPVHSIAFYSNSILASGDEAGHFKLWDVSQRRPLVEKQISSEKQTTINGIVNLAHDQWFTQVRGGEVAFWSVREADIVQQSSILVGSLSFCKSRKLDENGVVLTPSNDDHELLAIDPRQKNPAFSIEFPEVEKRGLICSLSISNNISPSAKEEQQEEGEEKNNGEISSSTNSLVAVGFEGGQVVFCDLRRGGGGEMVGDVAPHTQPVLGLAFGEKQKLWTAAPDEGVKVSKFLQKKNQLSTIAEFPYAAGCGGADSICIRNDNKIASVACWDGRVRIYACNKPRPLATLVLHSEQVHETCFSSDSSLLASASKDNKIALWSIYPPQ